MAIANSRSINFTRIGVMLGAMFPIISITIDFIRLDLPVSPESVAHIFTLFPLHWIILSAPLILGSVFFYFGREFGKKEVVYIEEKQRNHEELARIENFLSEVAGGDFTDREYSFHNPSLAQFLKSLKERLREQKEQDEKRNWSSEGIAMINDILRYEADLQKLYDSFLSRMVTYTGCNQASLFLLSDSETLELKSCYAYDRKKFISKTIHTSEGLVGTCFMERDTIVLREVPPDYVRITSGLGAATPRFIVLAPVKTNADIEGVLELASFEIMPEHKIKFIERACDNLAAVVGSRKVNEKTAALLEDSRLKTEELRSHEEEMRQNMEELQATQEEMERKSRQMRNNNERLSAILDSVESGLLTLSENGIIESANAAAAGFFGISKDVLVGQRFSDLVGIALDRQLRASGKIKTTTWQGPKSRSLPAEITLREINTDTGHFFTVTLNSIDADRRVEKTALS